MVLWEYIVLELNNLESLLVQSHSFLMGCEFRAGDFLSLLFLVARGKWGHSQIQYLERPS